MRSETSSKWQGFQKVLQQGLNSFLSACSTLSRASFQPWAFRLLLTPPWQDLQRAGPQTTLLNSVPLNYSLLKECRASASVSSLSWTDFTLSALCTFTPSTISTSIDIWLSELGNNLQDYSQQSGSVSIYQTLLREITSRKEEVPRLPPSLLLSPFMRIVSQRGG